jgi:DNA excision repair protein ERCC-4
MEKVLRFLYLRKVYLWPRYHVAVKDYLARHEPEVGKGTGGCLF